MTAYRAQPVWLAGLPILPACFSLLQNIKFATFTGPSSAKLQAREGSRAGRAGRQSEEVWGCEVVGAGPGPGSLLSADWLSFGEDYPRLETLHSRSHIKDFHLSLSHSVNQSRLLLALITITTQTSLLSPLSSLLSPLSSLLSPLSQHISLFNN